MQLSSEVVGLKTTLHMLRVQDLPHRCATQRLIALQRPLRTGRERHYKTILLLNKILIFILKYDTQFYSFKNIYHYKLNTILIQYNISEFILCVV